MFQSRSKRALRWAALLTAGLLWAPLNGCHLDSGALVGIAVLSIGLFLLDAANTPT